MALNVVAQGVISTVTPSSAEEESFYNKLLDLARTVVSGKHDHFKLPQPAVEQLKASLASLNAPASGAQQLAAQSSLANGVAYSANATATNTQQSSTSTAVGLPGLSSLPGLQTPHTPPVNGAPPSLPKATSSGLDPIFLEKSAVLIKAENQHKRQHIERELQAQIAQGKRPGRDEGSEAPSLDMGAILAAASAREPHVSGLKYTGRVDSEASSFDTNDYYSSQVQSDWSSPERASKGSDRAAGAFPTDIESLEGPSALSSFAQTSVPGKLPAVARDDHASNSAVNVHSAQLKNAYEIVDDDEDDEYSPPDISAFAGYDEDGAMEEGQIGSDEDDDDYEPGEVAMDSNVPTPPRPMRQLQQYSPKVVRNHLTHIAAPQPNRVSPLAVAKGPNLGGELELVNGRPEVVNHKSNSRQHPNASRASTASPQNYVGTSNKKRRNKKRKRDLDQQQTAGGRTKKRRDRQAAHQSPGYQEARIKDEPVSPPPFASIADVQPYGQYAQPGTNYRSAEGDLVSPRHIPLPPSPYVPEPRASSLRYEYAQPASPSLIRVASPGGFRPVQRDNQDLRRVASIHHAQRPASPTQRAYSPPQHRTTSMTYGDPRLPPTSAEVRYQQPPAQGNYRDSYAARPHTPSVVTAPPPTKVVIDQYGNQYYAADPEPAPAPPSQAYRASVAPTDWRATQPEPGYQRAPSRVATAYAPPTYDAVDARMAPPPPKRRAVEEPAVQYVDANGYAVPAPQFPRAEVHYLDGPTSPVYQQAPAARYEMAPPPPRPAREQTSPVYAEPTSPVYASTRGYSVRPEAPAAVPQYARHSSVAPQPYARQASVAPQPFSRPEPAPAPPARAMSVMPGYEQPRAYAPVPQPVRYVDQYGREIVYQTEPRAPPPPEYRYR